MIVMSHDIAQKLYFQSAKDFIISPQVPEPDRREVRRCQLVGNVTSNKMEGVNIDGKCLGLYEICGASTAMLGMVMY